MAAFGAGYSESNRLLHYPFGNGGYYGVDVIQAVVEHVESLGYLLDIWLRRLIRWFDFVVFRQGSFPLINDNQNHYMFLKAGCQRVAASEFAGKNNDLMIY
jgi:hypothetical protein